MDNFTESATQPGQNPPTFKATGHHPPANFRPSSKTYAYLVHFQPGVFSKHIDKVHGKHTLSSKRTLEKERPRPPEDPHNPSTASEELVDGLWNLTKRFSIASIQRAAVSHTIIVTTPTTMTMEINFPAAERPTGFISPGDGDVVGDGARGAPRVRYRYYFALVQSGPL